MLVYLLFCYKDTNSISIWCENFFLNSHIWNNPPQRHQFWFHRIRQSVQLFAISPGGYKTLFFCLHPSCIPQCLLHVHTNTWLCFAISSISKTHWGVSIKTSQPQMQTHAQHNYNQVNDNYTENTPRVLRRYSHWFCEARTRRRAMNTINFSIHAGLSSRHITSDTYTHIKKKCWCVCVCAKILRIEVGFCLGWINPQPNCRAVHIVSEKIV